MNRFWGKHFGPALLFAVLALFSSAPIASGQVLRDMPPPPPAPTPTPTPKPTPVPLKDEDFEVIRVKTSLVMVPVSVVDAAGEPVLGLQLGDRLLQFQDALLVVVVGRRVHRRLAAWAAADQPGRHPRPGGPG